MRRSTLKEFIEKAIKKHNGKYTYSEFAYNSAHVKSKITCPEHGNFEQTPNSHVKGAGCPLCGIKHNTREQFIEKAIMTHGSKYGYKLVDYLDSITKVKITCYEHGTFMQKPSAHLIGDGCPKCGKKTMSTEQFLNKAMLKHGNKYGYEETKIIDNTTPVKIICYKHGIYEQSPRDHLNSNGCAKCSGLQKKTTEQFIEQAILIHSTKYDYKLVEYNGQSNAVKIDCPIHGIFEQRPHDHLNGKGCQECGYDKLRMTQEQFIQTAINIHGPLYGYTKVIFKSSRDKVDIECCVHGIYTQTATSHLQGHGCPQCVSSISKAEIKWLNHIGIAKGNRQIALKIGKRRFKFDGFDPLTNTVYEFYGDFWHGNPKIYKAEDKNCLNGKTFGELYQKTIEKEMAIISAGYNLITIWGSDFNQQKKDMK